MILVEKLFACNRYDNEIENELIFLHILPFVCFVGKMKNEKKKEKSNEIEILMQKPKFSANQCQLIDAQLLTYIFETFLRWIGICVADSIYLLKSQFYFSRAAAAAAV